MTWKELKKALENIPEDKLNEQAICWSAEYPIIEIDALEEFPEDMYGNDDWDRVMYPEHTLSDDELKDRDTELIYQKGEFYLYIA